MIERTFPPGSVATYEPGDADSLAAAVRRLIDEPAARLEGVAATAGIVREASWERESARYHALVERLAPDGAAASARPA